MSERPNIVFMMPDQLRADFLSANGADFIETTHIDSLADHGVRYSRCYSPHPLCVPARTALLTGMDGIKNGVLDNGHALRPDHQDCGIETWPEVLSRHDYTTVAVGKMHFYPWEARWGFQHRIIAEDKIWIYIQDDYHHFLEAHGYHKTLGYEKDAYHENFGAFISDIPWTYSVDHFVGQEAARWIREYDEDEPFAMMIGFPGPHHPYDPTPEYAAQFSPDAMPAPIPEVEEDTALMSRAFGRSLKNPSSKSWYAFKNDRMPTRKDYRLHRAYYAALIKQIDEEVGAVIDALRDKGMLDNTLVIFSSDHGDYLGDHGLVKKGSFFEGAARVPMLVRAPWIEGATDYNGLVSLTDVTATILACAGVERPSTMVDTTPLPALELTDEPAREQVTGMLRQGWMLARDRWKLVKYGGGGDMLFDLEADPEEQHNLVRAAEYEDVYRALDAELTGKVMASITLGSADRELYKRSLSGSRSFGRPGWPRPYPTDIRDVI